MTLRSLLRAMRPVHRVGICTKCGGSSEPTRFRGGGHRTLGWLCTATRGCNYMCVATYWKLARWVWPAVAVACLLVGLILGASRASAQEWSGSLSFRGETIRVTSECGAVKGGGLLRELEAGYQRAARDLAGTGVAVPQLGAPGWPYTIRLVRATGCPSNAIACSTTPAANAPKWGTVKALCGAGRKKNGDRAVDHERQHRYCLLVRPLVVPPRTLAELRTIAPACALADHPAGKTERFDVAGRKVAK